MRFSSHTNKENGDMVLFCEEHTKSAFISNKTMLCPHLKENQDNLDLTYIYPACYDLENIICVGACDRSGYIYEYSGFGKIVDIYAPGEEIYCLMPENTYNYSEGTSLSVAMISAVCAIKKSLYPNISIKEIKNSFYASEDEMLITKVRWEE